MRNRPTGTITFLFTDIEGSTKLWENHPQAMQTTLARHDAILHGIIEAHDGYVWKTVGDAFCAAFATALDALSASIAAQRALYAEVWAETKPIKVRMALHTGTAQERDNDYFGPTLNRVARLLSTGHGGQLLLSLATLELVRDSLPRGVSLRDFGERRLKDLTRPEHIFQLVIPDLPADFAPLKTLETFPNNLPMQLTSFVGREREMAEVKQLLGTTHLLTLTGSGGAGKTRLSLQVAADLLDSFDHGVWFVELARIADPTFVPQMVASVLGIREESPHSILEMLINYVREKQLLLLLDNCEHVIEACARLAEMLLRAAPGLRILTSTREALGIAGETTWRIPSLSYPDPQRTEPIERLTQYEAVRLFIDRATAVLPSFAVTNQNAPTVAQICARLDGIPLAIELASAWVKILKVERIAARLDDRFRLLTGGSRTASPRHQTLRALIDWSYDLLSKPEQILLLRLSVFVDGWILDAAEAVCAGEFIDADEVLSLLAQLVNKSLIMIADEQGVETRYRLLETIRQYAQEKLDDATERQLIHSRHLSFFLSLAEQAETQLHGPKRVAWFERLGVEQGNLQAALAWSLRAEEATGGLRTGGMMETLTLTPESRDKNKLAWSLYEMGNVVYAQEASDLKRANTLYQESLALFQETRNQVGVTAALGSLGEVARFQGEYERAEMLYKSCLALKQTMGEERGMVICLATSAELARALGKPERAARLLGAVEGIIEASPALDDPNFRAYIGYLMRPLRDQLTPAEMAAPWTEGRAMALDQAVAYALEEPGSDM